MRTLRLSRPPLFAVACTSFLLAAPAHASSPAPASGHGYYDGLRAQLRWVNQRVAGREVRTPDAKSRLLLARAAAERARLSEVGLDLRDVYGVIAAETSWFARDGLGRNGVTSQGLAQLEPATARSLGVRDANDPVEAVHAAATLLKEAAQWSARRIAGLRLAGAERAARLREGVSVYYNLSSAGRERWDGANQASLPVETQLHIRNVREGAQQADRLLAGADRIELPALPPGGEGRPAVRVAAVAPKAAPRPVGTIEWSGGGSDADGRRAGKHVVWSNGSVTREAGGRVRWTSNPGAAAQRNG